MAVVASELNSPASDLSLAIPFLRCPLDVIAHRPQLALVPFEDYAFSEKLED